MVANCCLITHPTDVKPHEHLFDGVFLATWRMYVQYSVKEAVAPLNSVLVSTIFWLNYLSLQLHLWFDARQVMHSSLLETSVAVVSNTKESVEREPK